MAGPFQPTEPDWAAKGDVLSSDIRLEGGVGEAFGRPLGGKRIQRVLFENGEMWDIPDEGPAQKVGDDPDTARSWRAAHPAEPAPTSQWSIQSKDDGSKWRVNELTGETGPVQGFGPRPPAANTKSPYLPGIGEERSFNPDYVPDTQIEQDPMDGSRWLLDQNTGSRLRQLSGALPGWVPGRGVVAPREAPQSSPAEWARLELDRAKANQPNISTSGRYVLKTDPWTGETSVTYELPPEQITPYQQATLDQNRTMNDADNQAAMMRQRLSTAGTVAGDIASSSQAARMWAMNPEWGGYAPGFEANGPYAQLLRMGGSSPQGIRLPEQQFDPTEAWRLATGAVGVR